MRRFALALLLFYNLHVFSQQTGHLPANTAQKWADSVYNSLNNEERIAQLMIARLSSIDLKTMQITYFDKKVTDLIKQYNIGGICVFQGSAVMQANAINTFQSIAKTPVLMCIDAEWGVGQRLIDSVMPLPKQMMLGAMKDAGIMYKYGQIVAEQCKRFGMQVNYAPVVDVNNNPDNPVINDRSFGENKYKVALFATQYMKGMQDMNVMACAKHFPGHGDVAVDSHLDLPVINKSMAQLDSLELYPFRQVFNAGMASTMIAHLYIPAIDNTPNKATSISKNNVTELLRNQLNFQGITFTDALDMKGVTKYFPDGQASVEAIFAGNDMLCLPEDVPVAIAKVKEAIKNHKLSWADIEGHCKKILMAKYTYGLAQLKPIKTENLTADLNKDVPAMTRLVAENAITLLSKKDSSFFPLRTTENNKSGDIAYIGIGLKQDNAFATRLRNEYNAAIYYFSNDQKDSLAVDSLVKQLSTYKKIIIGIHNINRAPANNFGICRAAINLTTQLQHSNTITFLFGNAYVTKNWCNAANLVVCYEDNAIVQNTAIDMLQGILPYKGTLPVTVCENYPSGAGITAIDPLPSINPNQAGFNLAKLNSIDSIVNDAIAKKAMPGCIVLVAKDGKIAYEKAFGHTSYTSNEAVNLNAVYDLASVTKICATTLALMKLYDEGKIDLKKKLGDYLSSVKGSNKENIVLEKLLLHEAGLPAYIPFYKETLDASGKPLPQYYATAKKDSFSIRVASNLYLRNDVKDSFYNRMVKCPLYPENKYVYSDLDFIFLGKIVETITGVTLDEYVRTAFYSPLALTSIGFKPFEHIAVNRIIPADDEQQFRMQLLRGDVHDQSAAMLGGVSGNAGVFSDAYDLAVIMQMLLNGGTFNGKNYLRKETVDLFTGYHSNISRRGYGFDKPEKDNNIRPEPYPALSASPLTFGHTGYTGTCVWADPEKKISFIFLSNRLLPSGNDLLLKMNIRPKLFEAIYQALPKN